MKQSSLVMRGNEGLSKNHPIGSDTNVIIGHDLRKEFQIPFHGGGIQLLIEREDLLLRDVFMERSRLE
jgi:hypothetical protein